MDLKLFFRDENPYKISLADRENSFLLAHDLKNFTETNGNFSYLSANVVYTHLQNNQ